MAEAGAVPVSRYAHVGWHADGTPYSRHFGDVYYSRQSGLEESRHVFLQGNDLPARFSALRDVFRVGELGFGTGLNFLAAWHAFLQHAPKGSVLEYHSCELYPLRPAALEQALSPWNALKPLTRLLEAVYNPDLFSRHVFTMQEKQLILTLYYHNASEAADSFPAGIDAWFLDGFAPGKNEDMWTNQLFQKVFCKTNPGGTAATFTVARMAREVLKNAGFQIEQKPGFGRKREMLTARKPFG